MHDPTESYRRELTAEINSKESDRINLAVEYGEIWDKTELQNDFDVIGFGAPYVEVIRKSDGKRGTVKFQHSPRYYFSFQEV